MDDTDSTAYLDNTLINGPAWLSGNFGVTSATPAATPYSVPGDYFEFQGGDITKLLTGGLRVDEEEEISGLDSAIHGERAFEID